MERYDETGSHEEPPGKGRARVAGGVLVRASFIIAFHGSNAAERPDWNLPKSTETRLKSSGIHFYGQMRQRSTFTKVMKRLTCGKRKDPLRSQTHKLICETWWRKSHGLGLHGFFWTTH